jgi:hypothetical protein
VAKYVPLMCASLVESDVVLLAVVVFLMFKIK